jgi:hypothetical protein
LLPGRLANSAAVFLVSIIGIGFGGCSDSEPGGPIDGAWSADLPGQVLLFVNLRASGTIVTGNGEYSSLVNPQAITLGINGQWMPPQLIITLAGWPGGDATFTAQLDQGVLSGTLSGAATSQTLTLRRG